MRKTSQALRETPFVDPDGAGEKSEATNSDDDIELESASNDSDEDSNDGSEDNPNESESESESENEENPNESESESEGSASDASADNTKEGSNDDDSSGEDSNDDDDNDPKGSASEDESQEEMEIVEETGCVPWATRYLQLKAFKRKNGHADPRCARGPDYHLGHWLSDQRYKYRKGTLQEDKIEKFRAVGSSGFGGKEEVVKGPKRGAGNSSEKPRDPAAKSKPRPTRKRRLGMGGEMPQTTRANPTERSGRGAKRQKKSGEDDYYFY